jgi:hypothetical protein
MAVPVLSREPLRVRSTWPTIKSNLSARKRCDISGISVASSMGFLGFFGVPCEGFRLSKGESFTRIVKGSDLRAAHA